MRIKTFCGLEVEGWQSTLQENYENDLFVWETYAEMYGLHRKLGYETPREAWDANPTIQGSVNPADFAKIVDGQPHWFDPQTLQEITD